MYRFGQEEIDAVSRVLASNNLFKTCGKETFFCEKELREKMGVEYAVLLTSGTAGLISALTVLGVGPGDEVIVPAYTYIASAMAVTAVGAVPVVAEVDETLTLDPADVEQKISKHTKAIMPVHMQGIPCNLDAICALAKQYHLFVVEDACQAIGGAYKGRMLGTVGNAGAFSFNQFKAISAGEGGAMVTNDKTAYENALIYHDSSAIAYFGDQLETVSVPQFCGNEYRTNEITSAILREQLKKLDGILGDLRRNKKTVMDALQNEFQFAPSNDAEGDCGIVLIFRFDSEADARKFSESEGIHGTLPIDTGKHVYTRWTPIIEKRGAFHPALDPFQMEANRELNFNCYEGSCPKTLDILSKTVYVNVNPDWDEDAVQSVISKCRAAK